MLPRMLSLARIVYDTVELRSRLCTLQTCGYDSEPRAQASGFGLFQHPVSNQY